MKTLNNANLNETVIIDSLNCSGKLHRRFLDLGIIPGTQITPVFSSIFNDPIAYEVKIQKKLIFYKERNETGTFVPISSLF